MPILRYLLLYLVSAPLAAALMERISGEMPYIQPLADWLRKREFPVAFNPELASN